MCKSKCRIFPFNSLKKYTYVLIFSVYQNKMVLSKHRERTGWENQGGKIEKNETEIEAARRELYEESGAKEYKLYPLCDYWAKDESHEANTMVFFADIITFGQIPESEIEYISFFDRPPKDLTYSYIFYSIYEFVLSQNLYIEL